MAYSYNEVGPISSGQNIVVSFPFLSRDHVSVTVDGVAVSGSLWSWSSDSLISALVGFPTGTKTRVLRRTPSEALRGELQGSAVFNYKMANANFYQQLYINQERSDDEEERASVVEVIREELETQQQDLDASVELGRKWANEAEDVVVAIGEYSAKHYSEKSKDEAERARDWASKVPGLLVEGGLYSARHYANEAGAAIGALEQATAVIENLGFFGDWGSITEVPGQTLDYGSIV